MDIVERLRQRIGLVKFDSDAIALHDAADTIEQLRGQVDFERECREDTYADLEKQDAEIERLREENRMYWTRYWDMAQAFERRGNALHRIASMRADPEFGAPPMATVQKIAQKALEKE